MAVEWRELTKLTGGQAITIERVRLADSRVAIEGQFEPPPLASLKAEEQVFVIAFVRCHGSIKEMERLFGVSYPTIKNRLNRISRQLEFVEIDSGAPDSDVGASVLDALSRGEMSAEEAIRRLRQ